MDALPVMGCDLNIAGPSSTNDQPTSFKYTTVYKPIPIVGSSRSLAAAHLDGSSAPRCEISATMTLADIVALDHNYTFPLVEVPLLKPIINPSETVTDENKSGKCLKLDKPGKSPKISKKEKLKPTPESAEKPYWSGCTNYIFQIKHETPPKITPPPEQPPTYAPHIKSSVFPTSPAMSKLEHLLKSPTRSPSSRRSPSSFLSPSLNYHRCKNLAGPGPSVAAVEKEAEKEEDDDIDIDVESVDPEPDILYDSNRANNLMKECEKNVMFLREGEVTEDWEEQIVKTGWTNSQKDIFSKILLSLHQERLSRLVHENRGGEPVLRRLTIDKTAQRFRRILGSYRWDSHLTQWLHGVLVDNLSFDYLASYLDILQTLRVKFPELVDKMIILTTGLPSDPLPIDPLMLADPENSNSPGVSPSLNSFKETMKRSLNSEAIGLVLKRKWDPFSSTIQHSKTKKLPTSPIFVILATNPSKSHSVTSKRKKNFVSLLAGRGKVVTVTLNVTAQMHMRLQYYLGRLFKIAVERIRDLKRQFPERPIFIVGWASGAVLACKLSAAEAVAGVIAFGFRLHGLFNQGSMSANLMQLTCPSLFILGGLTNFSSILEIETLRQDMPCAASLLVVGCANDDLYVTNNYRKQLLVTQSYVDKCVVEEIVKFVSTCPIPVPSPEEKALSLAITAAKSKKKVTKLQNATVTSAAGCSADLRVDDKPESENERGKETHVSLTPDPENEDIITNIDFDWPIMIPSNTSSNKRKAYYRPAPSVTSPAEKSSPVCITASQLVQQNPGVKRFSKPSGPNIPKPKGQGLINAQPSTSLMKADCNPQSPLQPSMVSPTPNYLEKEPMSQPLVFNLLPSTSSQMLRMKRDQETAVASDIAAPTRFLFAVEESPPPSPSVVVDKGLKPYLPQPLVLPIQNNQIIKGEYEHSGFKQPEITGETQPAPQSSPPLPSSSKILSSSTPIITTPTILPGGATATPFIRRTLPALPPQQQFSSHLFRLLTPTQESVVPRAQLPEIPMPTRVTEDLTAVNTSSHLVAAELGALPKEISEPASSTRYNEDAPKEPTSSNVPATILPGGGISNNFNMGEQPSSAEFVSTSLKTLVADVAASTSTQSAESSLTSVVVTEEHSATEIKIGSLENKDISIGSTNDSVLNVNKDTANIEDTVSVVKASDEVVDKTGKKESSFVSNIEKIISEVGHDSSAKIESAGPSFKIKTEKKKRKKKEIKSSEKDPKTFSSPQPEKSKASFERIVESVAFGLDLEEESKVEEKSGPSPNSSEKKDVFSFETCEDESPKRLQKRFSLGAKRGKGYKRFSPVLERKSMGNSKKVRNQKKVNESETLASTIAEVAVQQSVVEEDNQSTSKIKSSDESPKKSSQRKRKFMPRKSVGNDKPEKKMRGNWKSKKQLLKAVKEPEVDNGSKEQELHKKLTRSSSTTTSEDFVEKPKEMSPPRNMSPKLSVELPPKSSEKIDSGRKKPTPSVSKVAEVEKVEAPISRLRNRSGNSSMTTPVNTNPHTLRKKCRLTYRETSDSDSSGEMLEDFLLKVTPKKKNLRQQKKKSSPSESFESGGESFDESEDKGVASRVTRSMRRQSVPDSVANESVQSSSAKEPEKEICATKGSEVEADIEPSKSDVAITDEKGKESRERNSSGSMCSGDDEDVEHKKRPKPIHPVTPASLSVTRTRKISIPNYFAYGM